MLKSIQPFTEIRNPMTSKILNKHLKYPFRSQPTCKSHLAHMVYFFCPHRFFNVQPVIKTCYFLFARIVGHVLCNLYIIYYILGS